MAELSVTLHGLALLLVLALVLDGIRRAGVGVGRGALKILLLVVLAGPMAVQYDLRVLPPADEVTVLHEGGTEQNIEQIHGIGVHAGPLFTSLRVPLAAGAAPDLRRVVWMNRILALAGGVVAAIALYLASGSFVLTLLLSWIYGRGMIALHLSSSELPAALFGLQFWAGVLAARELDRALTARAAGKAWRGWPAAAALALLVLVTGLVAGTRVELAGLGIAALGVVGLRIIVGDRRLSVLDRLPRRVWNLLRTRWLVLAGVVLAAAGLHRLLEWTDLVRPVPLSWLLSGWNPMGLSALQLPFMLATVFPAGLVLLFVLGLVYGVRRWRATLGMPLALLGLWGLYFEASHEAFLEAFRYLVPLAPAVLLLAALGWRLVRDRAAARGWAPGWERPALLVVGLLLFVPPIHGHADLYGADRVALRCYDGALIDMDIQREVRALLEFRDAHPDCLFVAPVTRSRGGGQRGRKHRLVLFHPSWDEPRQLAGDDGLDEALRRGADHACVLLYLGLDCNLAEGDGCAAYAAGAGRIDERVFSAAPYSDVQEYGQSLPEVRLELRGLRP